MVGSLITMVTVKSSIKTLLKEPEDLRIKLGEIAEKKRALQAEWDEIFFREGMEVGEGAFQFVKGECEDILDERQDLAFNLFNIFNLYTDGNTLEIIAKDNGMTVKELKEFLDVFKIDYSK